MMAEDKEILKEIWEGKLPICFRLSPDDLSSTEPDDLYVNYPFNWVLNLFLLSNKINLEAYGLSTNIFSSIDR